MAKRDYLVDAAKQIRMALDREVNEDYEAAFSYYKNGVDLLLNGVQVDPNKERREAVKRKTTQYLKRAEEIFNSHLQNNLTKGTTQLGGFSSLRFRSIRHLSSPVEDLEMCKVVGVIDKVLTVENLITKEMFVIKSLPKSSWESRERATIIPQGVPFMVKLLRYYVSEDSVFLHLEHVKGGKLFSKLHRIRSEVAREHPDCFGPQQHKVHLKSSYTSPALSELCRLNGEHNNGVSAVLEIDNVESPDTDSLAFWNETQHQLESCGTHSYCEETGCLQVSRSDPVGSQDKKPSVSSAIRTDSFSCVIPANQRVSQDSLPLPVHPCVIVDTRDPLSVTSDLLGNDVRIEWFDSSLDFDKALNAADLAQDPNRLTTAESNSDVLGISSVTQITLSSLFGGDTQPTLCSTVNVLPQKVRIVPNTLHLPSQSQKQEGFTHGQSTCNSQTVMNNESSQFMASLNSGNSQPCVVSPTGHKLQRPVKFSFDFMKMAPRLNDACKEGVKEVQGECVEVGEESWELISPPYRDVKRGIVSSPPACYTNCSDRQTGPGRIHVQQLIETEDLGHQSQFRASRFRPVPQQSRWGLPEAEVRIWGAQILLALENLHEQGIVCLDLNPRNILLNSNVDTHTLVH
ncbi:ribosomal protein S6 kinase delta-1 isoform X2 [Hoplias malabaricus]|uniref:ribosomal protein S6 kinase delta-1 isoform X2 n=1 Tax=Hoplias malabaricus TaxID=27720 RepID=UPI0034635F75